MEQEQKGIWKLSSLTGQPKFVRTSEPCDHKNTKTYIGQIGYVEADFCDDCKSRVSEYRKVESLLL